MVYYVYYYVVACTYINIKNIMLYGTPVVQHKMYNIYTARSYLERISELSMSASWGVWAVLSDGYGVQKS